jgi:hypothetical protein
MSRQDALVRGKTWMANDMYVKPQNKAKFFHKAVKKAIKKGAPLNAEDRDKIIMKMGNKQLAASKAYIPKNKKKEGPRWKEGVERPISYKNDIGLSRKGRRNSLYYDSETNLPYLKDGEQIGYVDISESTPVSGRLHKRKRSITNTKGWIDMTEVTDPSELNKGGHGKKLRTMAIDHFLKSGAKTGGSNTISVITDHMNKKYGARVTHDLGDKDSKYKLIDKLWLWNNQDYLANIGLDEEKTNPPKKKHTPKKIGALVTKGRGMSGKKSGKTRKVEKHS